MAILSMSAGSYSDNVTSSTWHIHQLHAELVQVHMVVVGGTLVCWGGAGGREPLGWVGNM